MPYTSFTVPLMARKLTGFIGFPDQKMKAVIVPDLFFVDLLPQLDDLAELKLTLHCLGCSTRERGSALCSGGGSPGSRAAVGRPRARGCAPDRGLERTP